jgi:hypothetical protein
LKIALCFSGQLRDLDRCYAGIRDNVIGDKHEVDVFAHGWWDESMASTQYKDGSTNFIEKADKYFCKIYKPVKAIFEKQREFDLSAYDFNKKGVARTPVDTHKCIYHMVSMWHSVKKSHELALSENKKYDFYVRCRTDLVFKDKIEYENLDKDVLYLGDGRIAGVDRIFGDWFACSNLQNMNTYCEMHDLLHEYNKNGLKHMHIFMQRHLKNLNCDTDTIRPDLYYFFKERGWIKNLGPVKPKFRIPRKKTVKGKKFNPDNNF